MSEQALGTPSAFVSGEQVTWCGGRTPYSITELDRLMKRFGYGPFTVHSAGSPDESSPDAHTSVQLITLNRADGSPVTDSDTDQHKQFHSSAFKRV